ncbi:MAG: DMT family transporter [Calditrichia bacterium]
MIYILLAAVLWGSSFPVISYALNDVSPLLFVFLRFVLAFLLFFPLIKNFRSLRTIFHLDMFLIAQLPALGYIFQFKAQELTTASKTALFVNTNPLFIALLAPLLLKTRIGGRQFLALIVALAGIIITTTNLNFSDFRSLNVGDFLSLMVSLVWSLFLMFSGKVVKKYGERNFNMALYFWIFFLTIPLLPFENIRFSMEAMPAIIYLSLFATIAAFYLYSRGIRTVSAFSTSILFLVEIIVASGISYFFLGERFTLLEIAGAVMILFGVVMVLWNEQKV